MTKLTGAGPKANWCGFFPMSPPRVRSAALTAIGETAIFQRNLDLEVVLPEIHRLADDPDLAGFVEDCLEDIRHYINVH
jgi:hypothetical protein